jgi:hypothetical protein
MKTWLAALTLATLAAATLGALGPALNTPSAPAPTAHDRMRAAAQAMCGSENAAWQEVSPGVIQCFTTGGRKLKRTTK